MEEVKREEDRLTGPQNTVVRGIIEGGKVVKLEERRRERERRWSIVECKINATERPVGP